MTSQTNRRELRFPARVHQVEFDAESGLAVLLTWDAALWISNLQSSELFSYKTC